MAFERVESCRVQGPLDTRGYLVKMLPAITSIGVILAFVSASLAQQGLPTKLGASLGVDATVQKSWSESAPYFPLDIYRNPPIGCEITQVRVPL